eukprot:11221076-Lingulodinium_polyedra.AAC.1
MARAKKAGFTLVKPFQTIVKPFSNCRAKPVPTEMACANHFDTVFRRLPDVAKSGISTRHRGQSTFAAT